MDGQEGIEGRGRNSSKSRDIDGRGEGQRTADLSEDAKKIHFSKLCLVWTDRTAHFWTFPESPLPASCLRTNCSRRRYRSASSSVLFGSSAAVGVSGSFPVCVARSQKFATAFSCVVSRTLCSLSALSACLRFGCVEILLLRRACARPL